MLRIAVMVSGGGTNLQAIIDAIAKGRIRDAEIVKVISNKKDAYALQRAEQAGIKTAVVSRILTGQCLRHWMKLHRSL